MNSLKFLEELYNDKPEDAYILIWKNKKSDWYQDILEAANRVDNNPNDTYFGVGLSAENYGPYKRCEADKILALPGLYADLDVGKKNYPKTIIEARRLVEGHGFNPTMLIKSGTGIHAYWLFKELEIFDKPSERMYAAEMSKRLNNFLKFKAGQNGWDLDAVGDLSRLLRPIGSFNCKDGGKAEVKLIHNDGIRYEDLSAFESFLPEIEDYSISGKEIITAKELDDITKLIQVKKIAEPPREKLDMLLDIDLTFKEAWQHIKSAKKDGSPSGFHFTLCIIAAKAGWTDQEIANLIIAWNRRHSYDLKKVLRPDYMARTIVNARKTFTAEVVGEYSKELETLDGTQYEDPLKDTNKKKAQEVMSYHLGFKIFEIIKYIQERDPKYRMITAKGDIYFKSPDDLMMLNRFQQRVLAHTNIALSLTKANFGKIKNCYKHIIRDIVVSDESDVQSRLAAWITEYLDGEPMRDQHEAARDDQPFVFQGHWYIFSGSFKEWAFRNRHDRDGIEKTELDLKIVEAEHTRFNPMHPSIEGKRVTKRPWKIPHSIIIPGDIRYIDQCKKSTQESEPSSSLSQS